MSDPLTRKCCATLSSMESSRMLQANKFLFRTPRANAVNATFNSAGKVTLNGFLGIFEPTGLPSSDPKKVQESKHPASDRDMAYKLVAGPMFGKVFLLDELRQLVQDFNLDDIILTEIDNLENAGKIIARGTLEIEKNQNNGGAFLASLRK